MRTFRNGGRLVEDVSELPDLRGARNVFVDFETTSGDPSLDSLDPWHHCGVAGLAITTDDTPGAWYVPVGHFHGGNLPDEPVEDWWCDTIDSAEQWTNHNVKYDAHVSANCMGVLAECELYDTLTMAKLIDSDRALRGGYGLKDLSKAWLREDIGGFGQAMAPYLHRNKDYGRVPADICGEYACQDVLTNRRLYQYIETHIAEQCRGVRDTEFAMTRLLFEIEREGMHVHPQELAITEYRQMARMLEIDEQMEAIVGRSFRAHVNSDCFDVLCNQYGLPVLGYTKDKSGQPTNNPSFDKKILVQYSHHPHAPPNLIKLMIEYRNIETLLSFFIRPYQKLHIDGVLHPRYNQMVRTGRMSSSTPNAQQLSPTAKRLIHPPPGHVFISTDASQIEFRVIGHYIQNEGVIDAYQAEPDTDFHTWVADMCEMARKPAKSINFMMGYGGGEKMCVKMLAANLEVVGALQTEVDKMIERGDLKPELADDMFGELCRRKAKSVYRRYHETLPELKRTSYRAAGALKSKGFIYNLYGRHRHLPVDRAHLAFNNLCQSSAADLVKERMVALAAALRGSPVKIVGQVHDEIVMTCPEELVSDELLDGITNLLEHPECELRVPIRWDIGVSGKNWYEASSCSSTRVYSPKGSVPINI